MNRSGRVSPSAKGRSHGRDHLRRTFREVARRDCRPGFPSGKAPFATMRRCLRMRAIVPRLHIEASGLHPSRFVSVQYLRSEEHTSELQSLMRISYAVFCLKKKKYTQTLTTQHSTNNTTHH